MSKRGGAAARRRKEDRRARVAEHRRTSTIKVVRDFTATPGGRTRDDGPHSGEEFREEVLLPRLKQCSKGDQLVVDLDGAAGYAASFLEEAFGGAARELGARRCLSLLRLVSNDQPELTAEIQGHMRKELGA